MKRGRSARCATAKPDREDMDRQRSWRTCPRREKFPARMVLGFPTFVMPSVTLEEQPASEDAPPGRRNPPRRKRKAAKAQHKSRRGPGIQPSFTSKRAARRVAAIFRPHFSKKGTISRCPKTRAFSATSRSFLTGKGGTGGKPCR